MTERIMNPSGGKYVSYRPIWYADDGLVHCWTEQEAQAIKAALAARLAECHLEMHPDKTKIVYRKDGKRQSDHPNVAFDFLGYCFRPRLVKNTQNGKLFCGFNPAVSTSALAAMRATIRDLNLRRRTHVSLADIAQVLNPLLRGWVGDYGRYAPSALRSLFQYVNKTLLGWVRRKFKRFKRHKTQAGRFLETLARDSARLFVHWRLGVTSGFT